MSNNLYYLRFSRHRTQQDIADSENENSDVNIRQELNQVM